MIITLKYKDTLIVDDFKFKCSIGKNGIKKNKIEGDGCTPKGTFSIGNLYYRADRILKPKTKLFSKKIHKKMGWCNDSSNGLYNKEVSILKKIKCEKIFRKDYKYNLFILIKYNYPKCKPGKGSAIFLHLTKNYKPTAGCIAILEKDFLILLKLINSKTKIKIN
tara:strand:+ start:23 stop:514 length:492 start_codon:yes stop_codon:yes gene_type:complete